ncbi:class I adenylate-forming enzyme family protein [Sulfitobacter aestuarii]|uniref:Class I adenylate-forming enzyme family protein n=1 Tax=Sulfitobacter aestuarii TaxID=2161676 RepID=A0ABW5U3H8_9RHOB
MDSIFDHGGFAPCPAPFNMAAHVLALAGELGDKTALSILHEDRTDDWSFHALSRAVRGTATGLRARGLDPGARVLLRLGNEVDFPIAYLGALTAGLVPVPTAAGLTEPEVARIIAGLSPGAILRDPAIACPDDAAVIGLDDLRKMRSLPAAEWHMGDPERVGYIIYTSGTSGQPMPVVHAHRAIWARRMMHQGWYGIGVQDRLCHAGAFNWTYTLGTGLMDPWSVGATALIPAPGTDPARLPALLKRHQASIFAAAPGVYRQILKHHQKLDLPDLHHALSAGEKLSPTIRSRWHEATGGEIHEAFGMSECSTFISGCPADPPQGESLGRPQPGRRVALLDADGPVPLGQSGTIAIHRSDPGLMLGYLDAPEQTVARFQGDWFLTGDQGAMDAQGRITYEGRRDDMMNAGGFRVSPLEVEGALAGFPGLEAVAAAEVTIKTDASVIAAFYTAACPLDEAALRDYAGARLARYKQPRLYIHLPALPTGANGKILRRALREHYEVSDHGRPDQA